MVNPVPDRPGGPSAAGGPVLGRAALIEGAVLAADVSMTLTDPRLPDHPLIFVNPAFTRTTGYPAEEALGRNCRFLQHEDADPEVVARMRTAVAAGEAVDVVLRNRRRDGTAFWSEVALSPLRDHGGELVAYLGIQQDVTPRVLAEQARERAHDAEQAAQRRLSLLADVADAVADLAPPVAMRRLAAVLTAALVPWCVVLVADDVLRLVASAGLADPQVGRPYPLRRGDRSAEAAADPLAAQLAGSGPGLVAVDLLRRPAPVTDPAAPRAEPPLVQWLTAQLRRADEPAPPGAAVSLPLPGRDGVLGLLVVGEPPGGLAAEATTLREVARRVGLSLENARLYAQQHLLAETLQRSMLPEATSARGLDLWSYYAPSETHAQVGGDWYDVLHPAGAVGLVIGDVVGHDIEAAAAMGQLRSVVRAYAYELTDPGTVLERVDQLVAGMRVSRPASMVYARLVERGDGRWRMTWSRAGHLPPVLLHRGAVRPLLEGAGTLVGFGEGPRRTATELLEPGDAVVLCTDGLVERRSRPLREAFDALLAACREVGGADAAGIGEHLLTRLGDAPEDDMAVVVLRVPPRAPDAAGTGPATGPRRRRWQLPGEPASVARARQLVVACCARWGLAQAAQAELVVSELVGNAVLHGWGPVGLRLDLDERGLLVEVSDSNPMPPGVVTSGREGPGGFGLHVVDRLSSWGWYHAGAGKVVWARLAGPGS